MKVEWLGYGTKVGSTLHDLCLCVSGPVPTGFKRTCEPNTKGLPLDSELTISLPYNSEGTGEWKDAGQDCDEKNTSDPSGNMSDDSSSSKKASQTFFLIRGREDEELATRPLTIKWVSNPSVALEATTF